MPIGPSLPPHLAHLSGGPRSPSPDEAGPSISKPDPAEDEDDDDFGPALPPHLAAARKAVAGPSRPVVYSSPSPPRLPSRTLAPADDDDSGDEVIGPMPVDVAVQEKSAVEQFMEREARWAKEREEAAKPKKLQREEWMLVPPSSGILSSVDPLRKRPTQFSKSTTAPVDTDSTIWTETPAEKAQRLADEVAGIKRKKDPKVGAGVDEARESARKRRRDEEIREGVERHNKSNRGDSLLNEYQKKKKESKDEEAPAIWDHSRDMGITGRLLSDQERSAKIQEAKGLNDRFGHSKRGAFDM